jgi:hypothetical protein
MGKRLLLRLICPGLHRFCLWRIAVWERRAAEAQRLNDWALLRTYLYRQEQWECRARTIDQQPSSALDCAPLQSPPIPRPPQRSF